MIRTKVYVFSHFLLYKTIDSLHSFDTRLSKLTAFDCSVWSFTQFVDLSMQSVMSRWKLVGTPRSVQLTHQLGGIPFVWTPLDVKVDVMIVLVLTRTIVPIVSGFCLFACVCAFVCTGTSVPVRFIMVDHTLQVVPGQYALVLLKVS